MKTVDKIKSIVAENSNVTVKEISESLGFTRQHINNLCKLHLIKVGTGRIGCSTKPSNNWKNHFGNEKKLTSHFIGGASELCACADLLRRGIPVYRAVTFVSAADLVIDMDGELLRVEVRSAKHNSNGTLRYPMPKDRARYDVLALVDSNGDVFYKPDLFE